MVSILGGRYFFYHRFLFFIIPSPLLFRELSSNRVYPNVTFRPYCNINHVRTVILMSRFAQHFSYSVLVLVFCYLFRRFHVFDLNLTPPCQYFI